MSDHSGNNYLLVDTPINGIAQGEYILTNPDRVKWLILEYQARVTAKVVASVSGGVFFSLLVTAVTVETYKPIGLVSKETVEAGVWLTLAASFIIGLWKGWIAWNEREKLKAEYFAEQLQTGTTDPRRNDPT